MASDAVGGVVPEQPPLSLHSIPASEPGAWTTAMNNLGIVPMGLSTQQIMSESLCLQRFDPALGLLAPLNPLMGLVHSPGPGPGPGPGPDLPVVKEIIHCESCTLFPQNPNLPPPSTRERPPGCRTVFVGGLPENATEEIIREVFDQCGEIMAIRKSKKNFCHIRFIEEYMVDKAMYLSGYRMRIGSSTDKKDSGKIHVDFAQARDDLYEWECKQRLWAREERHRQSVLRPPSPPPIVHYSEHEAGLLADRLKDVQKFSDATAVLLTWIERGEVNRRNANMFYSMIQSTNSHVRQLINDKAQSEEDLERAKDLFKTALMTILNQFEQICGVFSAASKQKAWDHFTKAQRKNIEIWRKQCEELRMVHSEEVMTIRREEEMEMSDEEETEHLCKRICTDNNGVQSQASLCEENDSLRWQLDAYRNELDLLRRETRTRPDEDHGLNLGPNHNHGLSVGLNHGLNPGLNPGLNHGLNPGLNHGLNPGLNHGLNPGLNPGLNHGLNPSPEAQIQQLQQNMNHMQQQLLSLQDQLKSREDELELAREEQRVLEREIYKLQNNNNVETVESTSSEVQDKAVSGCVPCLCPGRDRRGDGVKRGVVTDREALLLGVMSTFLHVHPFGANLEYLWSYIQRLDSKATASELERLMLRLPSMFRQELSGVGANLEKRWKFCGFDSLGTQ